MKTRCIVFSHNCFSVNSVLALLASLVSLLILPGFSPEVGAEANCPTPEHVVLTGKTSSSVSLTWDGVDGATGYALKFVRHSDDFESSTKIIGGTSYTFSGLQEGVYDFYIVTRCGGGVGSEAFVLTEDVVNN